MNKIFLTPMADENDPEDPQHAELFPQGTQIAMPACGRVQDLASDVVGEVMRACPRCTGTGPDCLIDLMYAEAFPSQKRH
ncbi:hypothetical protein [Rhodovibrio salinarum]|uniref:Uncharacterized protein n=1 Tax=Rhodovibrio salinarum TaxID=1087 RepID=A0A934QFL1_9PROT|nr:hypothetical protein [Rhodovibrio salinarum]MBK1696066.1 hypothetical protein [Rhodovibrio salinarum]